MHFRCGFEGSTRKSSQPKLHKVYSDNLALQSAIFINVPNRDLLKVNGDPKKA